MRKLIMASVLGVALSAPAIADDYVVPQDTKPFKITTKEIVRIPVRGIAGTSVEVKVDGKAKEKVNSVNGRKAGVPLTGPGNQEVEIKPSASGKVKVTLTVKPPNGPSTETVYEFEVTDE